MFCRRGVAIVNDRGAQYGFARCDLPQHWRLAASGGSVRRPPLRAVNTPPCPSPQPAPPPPFPTPVHSTCARNAFTFYGRYYIMFLPGQFFSGKRAPHKHFLCLRAAPGRSGRRLLFKKTNLGTCKIYYLPLHY